MALSKGCTIGIIVGLVLIVIIVVGIYLAISKGPDVLIDMTRSAILKNLPDGYTSEMVNQVMDDLKTAYKNDQLSGPQIQELVASFQASMADKEIDKEEGRKLLVMIQGAIGQEPPPVEEIPEEEMLDTLQAVPDSV